MNYKDLMKNVITTVQSHGIIIDEQLGHLAWIKERENGKKFGFSEHLRGLIYSQLSNQRPWHQVQEKLSLIDDIFFNYDVDKILNHDYRHFVKKIREIRCGNISIEKQMQSLSENIYRLKEIEKKHGSLDDFVLMSSPEEIATLLATNKEYKIKYMGFALALEYLRNVGINEIKPDIHIRRIVGNKRLSLVDKEEPNEKDAIKAIKKLSEESGLSVAEVDAYLWLYCATGYCNICGAVPQCTQCSIAEYCKRSFSL